MERVADPPWHHLDEDAVVQRLGSDVERGLDPAEVAERQQRYGPNVLTKKRGPNALLRFFMQFHSPLLYVLLAAAIVTALLREWVESVVIFGVVLVNAAIGYLQESKAVEAIEALSRRMASEAVVVRGGQPIRVPAATLVPGDVVLLKAGDKAPADVRVVRGRELRVDESALTGESVPVEKNARPAAKDAPIADRTSMIYASTFVTHGQGRAVVVATGDRTEVGRIQRMLSSVTVLQTPLTRKLAHFSDVLLVAILALGAAAFGIGVARGQPLVESLMAAVALAVGAIPEGLPAAVTIILAIGVARMARRNALVRRLPAVETLGSTTVICTDKTGTLTKNEMTVQWVMTADAEFSVTGVGYSPEGEIVPVGAATKDARAESGALRECLLAGLLCNDARLFRTEEGWSVEGDPTEAALVVAARKLGLDEGWAERWTRLDVLPFQSEHQYMATLHDVEEEGRRVAYVKGAVERIVPRCANALDAHGAFVALDAEHVKKAADRMTERALRVLALARVELEPDASSLSHTDLEGGLTFLGLVGMIDPPRPEAIAAVRACHDAGIDVKMITGDHAGTAVAIARQIGIGADQPVATSGAELATMSEDLLAKRLPRTNVFARVAPEHKLRIVRALQRAGHVVAMTGDGVNDAPALRQADIGVAMGRSGTDVAKESADMVLTDDNFASIAAAVEEGRGVFDNLRKFIVWTIPTNVGQGLVVLVALAVGAALPILPLQILWINMTTAILLGTPLAFEPTERDVMSRPPRDPKSKLLTSELVKRSGLVGILLLGAAFGLYEWELERGASLEEARTVATTAFIGVQAFYLLSCRSLLDSVLDTGLISNLSVWAGIGAMLALQAGFVYVPAMNDLFGSAPLPLAAWLRIFGVAAAAFAVIEVEKGARRKVLRARRRASESAAAAA